MASELRKKLAQVKLLNAWDKSPRTKIEVSFDQCVFEAYITHAELDAHLTLLLTISAPDALAPMIPPVRKDIKYLEHANNWQLFFTDGAHVDVKVKEVIGDIY